MKHLLHLFNEAHAPAVANALAGQKGDVIPMRFIEPGLVHYENVGTVLVQKSALDSMAASFVGKPVFGRPDPVSGSTHKDVSTIDFSSGRADGVVARVWYEPADGWYWADVVVWDPETKENLRSGWLLSCAYDVSKWSQGGGIHNNIPYDREVLEGEYTHLAIVPNPRYEGVRVIYNSQGGLMKLKFWQKEKQEPQELESERGTMLINGKEVPLGTLVELFNAAEAQKTEKDQAALFNGLPDDAVVEINGRKTTVGDLKKIWNASQTNASEEALKESHKDGKHDEKDVDNCPMCNARSEERRNAEEKDKQDKERDEKEKKDMENAHAAGSHAAAPLENCTGCKDANFQKLKNAHQQRDGDFKAPDLRTQTDRVAEGEKRYGSVGK